LTQGKIERWHRSMKNQVLLEHHYLPAGLERHIGKFVEYYNHKRYHESLNNLTPADVFDGRGQQILNTREKIKLGTLALRKQMHNCKSLQYNLMT
jgi:putative transposase